MKLFEVLHVVRPFDFVKENKKDICNNKNGDYKEKLIYLQIDPCRQKNHFF